MIDVLDLSTCPCPLILGTRDTYLSPCNYAPYRDLQMHLLLMSYKLSHGAMVECVP